MPENKINAKVDNGKIYLIGEVMWYFEKNAAKNAVKNLPGVRYVVNYITLKNTANSANTIEKIKKNIRAFFGYLYEGYYHENRF